MNGIEGGKLSGRKLIYILDPVVTINKYNKTTIYHTIYIKILYKRNMYYITVSTDDELYATNNEA